MSETLQTPRGTRDILPSDQKYWQFLVKIFEKKSETFGCAKIETPIFEYAEVFTRSLGGASDIVSKEMYQVSRVKTTTQEGEEDKNLLILRPELTAGIARAYVEHGMKTWPQPVKLYYEGPIFRYERPQAGRYRIAHQMGVEIIGDAEPLTDSSVIFLAHQIFKKIGLSDIITIDINSIGCATCRPKMRKKLVEYFEKFLPSLCEDCNRRFADNPMRILDCKNEKCQKIIANAPQLVDMLCADCKTHFKSVLENLDNLQIPYNLNPRLVRGLDYYSRTVFEIFDSRDTGRQSTLMAGGRYDGLLKSFGTEATPAIGFAGGIERIVEKMKEMEIEPPQERQTDVCIVQIGEKAQKMCLPIVAQLDDQGIDAACILGKESLKGQLRTASQMKAKFCVIIGQREVIDKSAILRNMDDASQETIKMAKLIDILKERLG